MAQLCASTIIRDEHIARLSLDLKEGDRFTLLRDAIGAIDAEAWIGKAQKLVSSASQRTKMAVQEVEQANADLANIVRQIDQTRSAIPSRSLVGEAVSRLQVLLRTTAPVDRIGDIARRRIVELSEKIENVRTLIDQADQVAVAKESILIFEEAVEAAAILRDELKGEFEARSAAAGTAPASTALSTQARQLVDLSNLGRRLGLREGHCPLCESGIEHSQFEHGLETALVVARQLDAQAVDQADRERERDAVKERFDAASEAFGDAVNALAQVVLVINTYQDQLAAAGFLDASRKDLEETAAALENERGTILTDLRLIETISTNQVLIRATEGHATIKDRVARAETRLGKARRAEARAKTLHDAARRAGAETLDQRLDRVLPLMAELYKRLRPHPVWDNIEYSVRGDVKRFLKLQVGEDVNPQFVFSSGQRRATGLAFLLSINLSIAWSRWRSILLDDPVQHVDDFRTVHLAEVLAHLCHDGRQIICAVEDAALADLMCRRLPTGSKTIGKRITLGNDADGALAIVDQREIAPLHRRVLVPDANSLSA